MWEQVKMLKNHAHFLSEAVDVQFYFLSGSIDIFFLCDIYTIKNDRTVLSALPGGSDFGEK